MKDDKNLYYVYIWYIVDTGEVLYVGKGTKGRYKQLYNRNKYFIDMYSSHNCDVVKIYDNLTEKEAFEKEKLTIKWYRENTNFRLTNQTDGGEGSSGWQPSEEFRVKQSRIHKEQWQEEDFRRKMLQIRQDENGVYKSKEFREKISKLVQGENNPNYHHKWTDEMKEKLRRQIIDNNKYRDADNPNAKKIICIETGEVFECIKFAIDKYQIKEHSNISAALKQQDRTAGGLHWAYYSEELLDDNIRFNYLINALLINTRRTPMICIEEKELFSCKADVADVINQTEAYVHYHISKYGYIVHNDKKYIKLKDYIDYMEKDNE